MNYQSIHNNVNDYHGVDRRVDDDNDNDDCGGGGGGSSGVNDDYYIVRISEIMEFVKINTNQDTSTSTTAATIGSINTRNNRNNNKDDIRKVIGMVETTAITDDTKEQKILTFILTTMDVSFFLIETLLKTIIPILSGKGKNAYYQILEIYNINEITSIIILNTMMKNIKYHPILMSESLSQTINKPTSMKWKSYPQFKYNNNNK